MRKAATSLGIAGNDLNRCEVPALQHKIRAKSKRTAVFFANSRLRVVRKGSGGQKRVAWDGSKESFGQRKSFWFMEKVTFEDSKERFVQKKSFWFEEKGYFFRFIQSQPIKKSFLLTQQNLYFPPHPN